MLTSTLCYIEKNNKFLMLYRNKKENDLNEGKWIGVGGKLEEGETVDACLEREVWEETGLKLTKYELRGVIKFISDKWEDQDMYLYYAWDFEGDVTGNCTEGELKWVDRELVPGLPTWEGDRLFMTPFLKGEKNIDMTVRYEGDTLVGFSNNHEDINTQKSTKITCPHGFSTREGGISEGAYASLNLGMNRGDIKERVIENWRRFLLSCGIDKKEFVCGAQVHKNNVHIATKEDARPAYGYEELIEADGYVTKEKGVPLAIFIADCVPVLLQDEENGVIGAVHCGWRSTVSDIIGEAVTKMQSLGAEPEKIRVAVGPAIERCCFEVGGEVVEACEKLLSRKCDDLYDRRGEKYMLDLKGVVKRRFLQLGIKEENMDMVGGCTMCNPTVYYSHRYSNGSRGSLAAVIMM